MVGLRRLSQPTRAHPTQGWGETEWRQYRWAYARLIEKMDAEVGRVMDALKSAGLREQTLVVYTSDHGDGDASHHWNQKMVLYEEAVRVPLIVSWPGHTPAGKVDDARLVSMGLDLLPTFCQFAGVPARGAPDQGEVNYSYIFGLIDELGYARPVGAEYKPQGPTEPTLGWLRAWHDGGRVS